MVEGTWSKNVRIKGRNSKTYIMSQDVNNNDRILEIPKIIGPWLTNQTLI